VAAATLEEFHVFALVVAFGYLHTPVHLGPLLKPGGTLKKRELESLPELFTKETACSLHFFHIWTFFLASPARCTPKSGMTRRYFNVYNFMMTVNAAS